MVTPHFRYGMVVNLFVTFHRSFVDPKLAIESLEKKILYPIRYLLLIGLMSILLSSVAQVYHLVSRSHGFIEGLTGLLKGVQILDGRLVVSRTAPYTGDRNYTSQAVEELMNIDGMGALLPDSMVIFDTSARTRLAPESKVRFLFTAETLFVNPATGSSIFRIPYRDNKNNRLSFSFSQQNVDQLVKKNIASLYLFVLLQQTIILSFLVGSALVFLTLMTWILTFPKLLTLKDFFAITCYSLSPLAAGNLLIALSGTRLSLPWYLCIFISIFLMQRGVKTALFFRMGTTNPSQK